MNFIGRNNNLKKTAVVLIAVLAMAFGFSGCSGEAVKSEDADTMIAVPVMEVVVSPEPVPEIVKYGILIDMTMSIPEELGAGLVTGTIEAISIPDLPGDLGGGMPAIGAQRFYISFVDANPLEASTLPSSVFSNDWTIPLVYPSLPPEPDLADPSVTYEDYDGWKAKEEAYRAQYRARKDAAASMKADLAAIDLTAIRDTAMASGIPSSFDKLARTIAAGEDGETRIIFVSDLDTNSHIEITSPVIMKGCLIGIIAGYGTVAADASIESFNAFVEPYGLGAVIPYRPEAEADAIAAWLSE